MPIDNLSADHIGGQNGGFEPQRANNALLYIAGLQGADAAGSGKEDVLTLSLASFPIPKVTNGIIEVGHLNEKRKFAGLPTFDDLSVVYKDYVDQETLRLLFKWRQQVYNPVTGQIGLAANYKKSGWVSLFSPDGQIERQYDIIGCWPSGMDPGDIDMLGEDFTNVTVTLTIDKAIPGTGLNPST